MDTQHSSSDANRPVEFYVPGTFQFSRAPGRIERFLRRLLRERGTTVAVTATEPSGQERPPLSTAQIPRRG